MISFFPSCLGWCHREQNREEITFKFSNLIVLKINAWKKVACVLRSEWPRKESITKWLQKQSMKHWKSLTIIDLIKKLPFSSTFLKYTCYLEKKQGKNLPSFSKLITETTKSQSGNIWKDQWCHTEVVYMYAWQQYTYQWPNSFRKSSQICKSVQLWRF